MSYQVEILFKANKEIFEAWAWYEKQQIGLGDRFENEVFKKIKLIQNNPFHYSLKKIAYEALVDKFPFLIIYQVNDNKKLIIILSIFHTSRHPKQKFPKKII